MIAEFGIRIVATALIVIALSLAVERLGPAIGGALAGLPIVTGPGFFFLARNHSVAFTADAGTASLLSLGATEAFLLTYCAVAFRHRPALALGAAMLAWIFVVFLLSPVSSRPLFALGLFVAAATMARLIGRQFLLRSHERKVPGGYLLLLIRGAAAGALVAGATLAADSLGSDWSGFIMTYPIGLSIISITVHQRVGAPAVITTLHSAMLGITSLAAFSFTLSICIETIGTTSWIQTSSATVDLKAAISSARASAGVLHPRVFLKQLWFQFVPVFHGLQGRLAAQSRLRQLLVVEPDVTMQRGFQFFA